MDTSTGLVIWSAEAVTLAVILWSRWFCDREPYYLTWGSGFCAHACGALFVALRGHIPDFVSIEFANAIILGGIGLWIAGLLQFDRRPVESYIAIPALVWVAAMFLDPVRENFAFRVVAYNLAASAGNSILIVILLQTQGHSKATRRFIAAFLTLQLATNLLTAVVALVYQPTSFDSAPNAMWLFLPTAFCLVGCTAGVGKLLTDRSEERLKALTVTDPLTGVLNRRGLIDEFHRLKAVDQDQSGLLAILHFDLDRFKTINDHHGHKAGDDVLVGFAGIGLAALRGRGSFGRMGGEEFAAILRLTSTLEAASIAEAIRVTVRSQRLLPAAPDLTVTVSIGIAAASSAEADLDALLQTADRALYAAKEEGRDRTAIADRAGIVMVPGVEQEVGAQHNDRVSHQVAALRRLSHLGRA